MRKLQTKLRHRSSTSKQQEVQLLHWMHFGLKTFKTVAGMKNDQHGKVVCLHQLSIGISLAQFWWVDGELGVVDRDIRAKKKHVKNRVKFKHTCREVQVLHALHFRRICFAIKAERTISPFSKLLQNGNESHKTVNMKKFGIFHSFSALYYLPIPIKFVEITMKICF